MYMYKSPFLPDGSGLYCQWICDLLENIYLWETLDSDIWMNTKLLKKKAV